MIDQVGHDAAGRATAAGAASPRASRPSGSRRIAFSALVAGAVGGVRLGDGQPERPLVIAARARPRRRTRRRGRPIRTADRRSSWAGRRWGCRRSPPTARVRLAARREVAEHQLEAVADELSRAIGLRRAARSARGRTAASRIARVGPSTMVRYWTVAACRSFRPRVADLPAREVPAPADRLDGLDRPEVPFGQPVEAYRPDALGRASVNSSTRKSSGWHLSFMRAWKRGSVRLSSPTSDRFGSDRVRLESSTYIGSDGVSPRSQGHRNTGPAPGPARPPLPTRPQRPRTRGCIRRRSRTRTRCRRPRHRTPVTVATDHRVSTAVVHNAPLGRRHRSRPQGRAFHLSRPRQRDLATIRRANTTSLSS